jgi:hypothetical protein
MSYAKKAAFIGKRAKIKTTLPTGLTIKVNVLDYKFSYGNDRLACLVELMRFGRQSELHRFAATAGAGSGC